MLAFPSRRPAADRAHVAATEWSRVPIRDFISLSSPLVAVSLLFFWCAAVKKEIPKNCGAAVANKKLSGSPAVFPRDANDDRKDDHHHGNDDDSPDPKSRVPGATAG